MLEAETIIEEAKKPESNLKFDIFEMQFYLSIKQIIKLYQSNFIPEEVAIRYKQKAIAAYKNMEKQFCFWNEIIQKHVDINKRTEEARCKLHKLLQQETVDKDEMLDACMQIISIDYEKEFEYRSEKNKNG